MSKTEIEAMQARWFPPYVVPKRPILGLIFEFIKIQFIVIKN